MKRRAAVIGLLGLLTAVCAPAAAQNVLTNADVIKMAGAGLSDTVVINSIESHIPAFDLSPEGLVELKKGKVSDAVVAAMQARMAKTSDSAAKGVSGSGNVTEVVIPDGTEVTVRLTKQISSADARLDDEVKFEAVDAVTVDGQVLIEKGAEAKGRVLLAQSKRSFGRKGKLDFSIDTVEAVDGQKIRLRYSREMRGEGRAGTAGVVTWLTGPFGFFVKGKDVEIPAGTEYTIFIDGERTVKLKQ